MGGSFIISLSPLRADLLSLMVQNCTKLLTFLWPENASHGHTQQLNSSQTWGTCVLQHPCVIGLLTPALCKEEKSSFLYLCGHCCHLKNAGICFPATNSFHLLHSLKSTNQSFPLLALLSFNTALTYLYSFSLLPAASLMGSGLLVPDPFLTPLSH